MHTQKGHDRTEGRVLKWNHRLVTLGTQFHECTALIVYFLLVYCVIVEYHLDTFGIVLLLSPFLHRYQFKSSDTYFIRTITLKSLMRSTLPQEGHLQYLSCESLSQQFYFIWIVCSVILGRL